MSDDLENDQKEFEGNLSSQMYRNLLERSYEKVAGLKQQLEVLQNQTITLRDKTATEVYPGILIQSTSAEQAAVDSYRAADALLRVRETGQSFDSDLTTILKEMRDSSKDDTVFGRTVRNFLNDK